MTSLDLAEAITIALQVLKKCEVPRDERVAVQLVESTLRSWLRERAGARPTSPLDAPSAAPSSVRAAIRRGDELD